MVKTFSAVQCSMVVISIQNKCLCTSLPQEISKAVTTTTTTPATTKTPCFDDLNTTKKNISRVLVDNVIFMDYKFCCLALFYLQRGILEQHLRAELSLTSSICSCELLRSLATILVKEEM